MVWESQQRPHPASTTEMCCALNISAVHAVGIQRWSRNGRRLLDMAKNDFLAKQKAMKQAFLEVGLQCGR